MKSWIDWVAIVLVIIGAINWGLIGAFSEFNLVEKILGVNAVTTIVYILVGLAGLWMIKIAAD